MIKSFDHKGLRKLWEEGTTAGIQAAHASKLKLILARLNSATVVQDMNTPGSGLHPLKGNKKDLWAVSVNGNWRITFRFEDGNAYVVDYIDYH